MISIEELKKRIYYKPVYWSVYRRVSLQITRLLVSTPVTPNQVTKFSILLILLAPFFIFFGYYLIASFLLICYIILDHVDGELARFHKVSSVKWGVFFDWIASWLSTFLPVLALILSVYFSEPSDLFLISGVLVIFGYAMVELIRLEDINIRPIKGEKQLNQKISTKEKFLIVYKRIFLIEPLHLVWVVFAFINLFYFGFIKYLWTSSKVSGKSRIS